MTNADAEPTPIRSAGNATCTMSCPVMEIKNSMSHCPQIERNELCTSICHVSSMERADLMKRTWLPHAAEYHPVSEEEAEICVPGVSRPRRM